MRHLLVGSRRRRAEPTLRGGALLHVHLRVHVLSLALSLTRSLSLFLLVVIAVTLAAGACDRRGSATAPKTPAGTGSGSASDGAGWAELLGVRGGQGVSSMADVIKGFPGFERCLERLEQSLPPDLGADLLPYYDLPDVLCRTREAMAKDDPSACQRVTSYTLKKNCEMMYAMYAKKPDLCPVDYPTRMGRNGYCLAVALRDPSLCYGAKNEEEEARCRAMLNRNDKECTSLTRVEKRLQCRSEAKRWASVVTDARSSMPVDYHPSFQLSLKATHPNRPAPFEKVKLSCADQGAIAPSHGDAAKVVFCDFYPYGYRSARSAGIGFYSSPEGRTKVAFEFRPPAVDSRQVVSKVLFGADATISIKISGYDEFTSATQIGEITFDRFERKRGGRIKGSLKVTLEQGGDRLDLTGTFDSFIRDLVSPTDLRANPDGSGYGGPGAGAGARAGAGAGAGASSDHGRGALGMAGGVAAGGATADGMAAGGMAAGGMAAGGKRYASIFTSAMLVPEQVEGKVLGFRVSNIQQNSLWNRLGIKERDLVIQLGAVKLLSSGDLSKVRTEVQNVKALRIRIKRAGRPQVLSLSRAQMQRIKDEFYF